MAESPESASRAAQRAVREASCPEHGAYTSTNLLGAMWTKCPECSAEIERKRAEEDRARLAKEREEKHQRNLDAVRIPERFLRCSFDSFVAETDAKRHALTVLRDYAERFDTHLRTGASLVLSGKPGTGKSHLAGAVLHALCDRPVRYVTCMDMIRAVRDTWRRDSPVSEVERLQYLADLELLVIDELGMQYGTEGEQTIIFDVLDRRYRDMRPVIIITNQDRDGLKTYVGERVFDRLRETARWIAFDWESYRGTARKAAAA